MNTLTTKNVKVGSRFTFGFSSLKVISVGRCANGDVIVVTVSDKGNVSPSMHYAAGDTIGG